MLISELNVMNPNPILALIASVNGNSETPKKLRTGVYEIGHFGGSHFLPSYNESPKTTVGSYGVCDSVEQLLTACPELEAPGRKFVVTLTPIRKSNQSEKGGWRWHRWGNYIGTQNPQCEYLYDEPHIEEVFCFQIYERMPR